MALFRLYCYMAPKKTSVQNSSLSALKPYSKELKSANWNERSSISLFDTSEPGCLASGAGVPLTGLREPGGETGFSNIGTEFCGGVGVSMLVTGTRHAFSG